MIISDGLVSKIIVYWMCCVPFYLCVPLYGSVIVGELTRQGGTDSNRFAPSTIALGSVSPN